MTRHDEAAWGLGGKRVTVLGLGREGVAVTRFLVEQGAKVTVTDLKSADQLRPALEALSDVAVRYVLGNHGEEVLDCELFIVSPGVPLDAPVMIAARQRRLPLSSECRLFCRLCKALVIGITGSSGKTTTCTLLAKMLEESGKSVHVGGNIGSPLLGKLREIQSADTVVLELSSFQLDFFGAQLDAEPRGDLVAPLFPDGGWSPPFAGVLNVTPNHLDRHPTMEAYVAAKSRILGYQRPQDHAVLGLDNDITRSFANICVGDVAFFSLQERVANGAYLRGDSLVLCRDGIETEVCSVGEIRLRGLHNVANVLACCALASLVGVQEGHMREAIRAFTGVEHRLEPVRRMRGVWYYNDSIATSPERAVAALRSFSEPIVLIAGGRDKHLPWDEWAELVSRKVVHVIAFGEAAQIIEGALHRLGRRKPPLHHAASLAEAVEVARNLAQPGQVVLFSPGGTSFDSFRDYAERGQFFKGLVNEHGR